MAIKRRIIVHLTFPFHCPSHSYRILYSKN